MGASLQAPPQAKHTSLALCAKVVGVKRKRGRPKLTPSDLDELWSYRGSLHGKKGGGQKLRNQHS
jgi:hypothetical protein